MNFSFSYRRPFDWQSHLAYLAYRSIPGVEIVTETTYARTISMAERLGHFIVEFEPGSNRVNIDIRYSEPQLFSQIIEKIKSIFDLCADSEHIDKFLAKDKRLKPMVNQFPGLRVPGCWSGFEVAVRAVLGQQVTVKAASTLVSRICARYGQPYQSTIDGLSYVFPEPEIIQWSNLDNMGIIGRRTEAIKGIAESVTSGQLVIDGSIDSKEFVDKICTIKGVGDWTALYIAMRALNDPNAFPYSDLILRRSLTRKELTPKQLLALSESWQPWRAYAVMLLWKSYGVQKQRDLMLVKK